MIIAGVTLGPGAGGTSLAWASPVAHHTRTCRQRRRGGASRGWPFARGIPAQRVTERHGPAGLPHQPAHGRDDRAEASCAGVEGREIHICVQVRRGQGRTAWREALLRATLARRQRMGRDALSGSLNARRRAADHPTPRPARCRRDEDYKPVKAGARAVPQVASGALGDPSPLPSQVQVMPAAALPVVAGRGCACDAPPPQRTQSMIPLLLPDPAPGSFAQHPGTHSACAPPPSPQPGFHPGPPGSLPGAGQY